MPRPRPLLLVLALVAAPATADAQGLPDPRFSTTDAVVVGNATGHAIGGAPAGFDVVVRDVNNAPIPGRVVSLDFSATAMRLLSVQNPGTTLDCAGRRISRVTNAQGAVNFAARLAGWDNTNAIPVFSGSEELTRVRGRSTDLDGADGTTGLGDFAVFGANFLTNPPAAETDFDLNGTTGLGDFAIFAAEFLATQAASYCP